MRAGGSWVKPIKPGAVAGREPDSLATSPARSTRSGWRRCGVASSGATRSARAAGEEYHRAVHPGDAYGGDRAIHQGGGRSEAAQLDGIACVVGQWPVDSLAAASPGTCAAARLPAAQCPGCRAAGNAASASDRARSVRRDVAIASTTSMVSAVPTLMAQTARQPARCQARPPRPSGHRRAASAPGSHCAHLRPARCCGRIAAWAGRSLQEARSAAPRACLPR